MDIGITLTAIEVAVILGFSVGLGWGDAFSGFDGQIKYESEWFKRLNKFRQWIVSCLLDATHHFQYGLALVLLTMKHPWFAVHPTLQLVLFYMGWGLVASDWADYKHVLDRLGLIRGDEDGENA